MEFICVLRMISDLNDTENTTTPLPVYTMSIPHSKLHSEPDIEKIIIDEKIRIYQLLLTKTSFTEDRFQELLRESVDLSFLR